MRSSKGTRFVLRPASPSSSRGRKPSCSRITGAGILVAALAATQPSSTATDGGSRNDTVKNRRSWCSSLLHLSVVSATRLCGIVQRRCGPRGDLEIFRAEERQGRARQL